MNQLGLDRECLRQLFNTHGTEIAPGSDVVGKDLQRHRRRHRQPSSDLTIDSILGRPDAPGKADRPRAAHLVTNVVIALDGAQARVRSNWMVMQNSPAGPKLGSGGAYADEFVQRDGRWLLRYRRIDRFIAG
ncbi:MAG TPA: nuclear transport factor 2 family protein [Stellaceae bacterium]|jgi:hypothetical protein|nr:nuclear transport factor 2 family protein [Stellaceae bacterium]